MRLAIFLRTIFALLLFLSVECETMHTAYGKVVEKQTAHSRENVAAAAEPAKPAAPKLIRHSVKISAVGDCTIGWDDRFPGETGSTPIWKTTAVITAIIWPKYGRYSGKTTLPSPTWNPP